MSAIDIPNGTNGTNGTNGSLNGSLNGSSPRLGGTPILKRGFSAINASVHEMYVNPFIKFINFKGQIQSYDCFVLKKHLF